MWPWEHAIVGYVAYSLFARLIYRDSPGGVEAFAVVFASVLPDLIDKPLAWEYGIFESGYALGHSIFFAVPLAITVGLLTRAWGRPKTGVAFAVGYLLHLPSDVFDGYIRGAGNEWQWEIMLWPTATAPSSGHTHGFIDMFEQLFSGYWAELTGGDPSTYLLAQLAIAAFAGLLWLFDGAPVVRELIIGAKRVVVGLSRLAASR